MQFIIDGKSYPVAALDRITGRHALDLVKQAGIGVATIEARLGEIARLRLADDGSVTLAPEGEDSDDSAAEALFSSEPHLRALLALVWMSRRFAGEPNLPFDAVLDLPIKDIQSDNSDEDDDEDGDAVDPTSPRASDPPEPAPADAA